MNPYENNPDLDITRDRVWYSRAMFGQEEIDAVTKCLKEFVLSPGKYTYEFEKKIAKLFDKDYGIMVNSGTSALMLAAELLDLQEGDQIITAAIGFPATINPFIAKGAQIVAVDVNPYTLSPNLEELEANITSQTKAIVVAHIFGAVLNMPALREIADRHTIKLIEDSCDSLGSTIDGESTGKWSDMSVTSFYASHVITAGGGGGMLCVKTKEEDTKARIYRDWGRTGTDSENLDERFSADLDGIPYDAKFVYDVQGYNLKATEMQAAFGLVQLEKLDKWNAIRLQNHQKLSQIVKKYGLIPGSSIMPNSTPSWMVFPFFVKDAKERRALAIHFETNDIQTRPILAGSFIRQKAYKDTNMHVPRHGYADKVAETGLGIGLHPGVGEKELAHIDKMLKEFYEHSN